MWVTEMFSNSGRLRQAPDILYMTRKVCEDIAIIRGSVIYNYNIRILNGCHVKAS